MKRKQALTTLHKQPRGHQPRRNSLVLRDKRQRPTEVPLGRSDKERLRRELEA